MKKKKEITKFFNIKNWLLLCDSSRYWRRRGDAYFF